MRAIKILLLSICTAIIGFIVSINFIFRMPLPSGSGLHYMTFVIGGLVAVVFALVVALVGNKIFKKGELSQREDRFKELSRLRDKGILNDDEYKQAKENLINKL